MPTPEIHVSAVIFHNSEGHVLCVRKKNTTAFQFPGGKPDPGETPLQAAVREVEEEIGVTLDDALLSPRDTFRAAAANEANHEVIADIFSYPSPISPNTAAEKQLYIDTGLSHLSAVSGSNVAIVCSAAALLVKGPRLRVAASLAALVVFVLLVGFEPSVQRAAVMGLVGLLAVLNSSRMEPMHGLSLAIIVLLFIDSELCSSFGFALSVVATAGIVVVSPLLYRHLAVIGWPDIFIRALAVAIAADLVTMPIVALMAGEVSVVSVLANVLVAPATAPVTILGLIAAIFAQLGPLSVLGAGLLAVAEPFTWWINTIAHGCTGLPLNTVAASPFLVLLAYGWVVAGIVYRRPLRNRHLAHCSRRSG